MNYVIPANIALEGNWPSDIFELLGQIPVIEDLLGKIGISYIDIRLPYNIQATIQFQNELSIQIPGIEGLAIVLGSNVEGLTEIDFVLNLADPFVFRLNEFPIRLRFPRNILQPVILESDLYVPDPDTSKTVDIWISPTMTFDGTGKVSITGTESIEVSSVFMIGDTGFVVDLPALDLILSDQSPFTPDGQEGPHLDWPTDFRGVWIPQARMHYHKEGTSFSPAIELLNVGIGTGGFTGTISLGEYARRDDDIEPAILKKESPLPPHLVGINSDNTELNEMQVIFQYFGITFEQSIPTAGEITGHLFMPFADKWMKFSASIGGPNGDFMLEIGGTADAPLISLEHELFEIKADSIAYKLDDGIHYAIINGSIKPKLPGFDWPTLQIEDLSISSEGDISIPGGWITAPEEITLDFKAFKIGIGEIGFGNEGEGEEKKQWLGFSGSINLVEGLELGASVEGLKFSWPKDGGGPVKVSMKGIGVKFEIPNTLSFEGSVKYETLTEENNGGTGITGDLFRGNIKLDLMALRFEIEAELMIGKLKDADGHEFTTFFIILGMDLPVPITLGATGTSLYSIKGMAAINTGPTKTEEQSWYEWAKADPAGVMSIKKVKPLYLNKLFGAEVGVATAYDNGFTLNMKVLLAILLPGPVIILEGKANILKKRNEDEKEEGLFYLLAVLDGRAGTFMLNIDVKYSLSDVITVGASVEAFFDFHSSDNWHLHIGKDQSVEKRIRAEILSLFSANAYFMIDSRSFKTGASVGWDLKKKFGPVSFALVARISFDAAIFWKPVQLEGALEMYAEIALKVFGIGLELYLRMLLEGKAPRPYYIHGVAEIGIKLFWPLPDIKLEVDFTWQQDPEIEPVWPLLKECSFMHHKDSSATWALPIEIMDFENPSTIENITILPVDSRPVLTFARPVHNLKKHEVDGVADPILNLVKDEVGGKIFKYQLKQLELQEWNEESWEPTLNGINTGATDEFTISDSSFLNFKDQVEPNEPQIQLWQYSIGDRGDTYQREDYNDHHPACNLRPQQKWMMVDWRGVSPNTQYDYNFEYSGLRFVCDEISSGNKPTVYSDDFLNTPALYIHFPEPVTTVIVYMKISDNYPDISGYVLLDGVKISDMYQPGYGLTYQSTSGFDSIRINGRAIVISNIIYMTEKARIEYSGGITLDHPNIDQQNTNGDLKLEPSKFYRLKMETSVNIGDREDNLTENYIYFKTDDGPGIPLPIPTIDPATETDEVKAKVAALTAYNAKVFHQFGSYIDRTLPVDGAKFFYSGYDMGIQFNEAYVEKLYSNPIKMVIKDRNGKKLEKPSREDILGSFLTGFFPLLNWGLLGFLKAKEEGDCAEAEQPEIMAPYLNFVTSLSFKPNSLYTVDLVTEANAEEHQLHKFQFTTSRYANFTQHILSAGTEKVEAITLPAISLKQEIPLENHLEAVGMYDTQVERFNASSGALNKYELLTGIERMVPELTLTADKTFDQLDGIANRSFAIINMENRPLPEKFEIFKIPILKEDKFILLLESPEPIEWTRVTANSINPDESTTTLGFVWNEDKTRAFMYNEKGHLFDKRNYKISFTFSGDLDPVSGVLLRNGSIVNEKVTFKLEL